MTDIKDGGPAFPQSKGAGDLWVAEGGATLRDYFAAHAVSGVLQLVANGRHELGISRPSGAAGIAHSAYEIADAMIAARSA